MNFRPEAKPGPLSARAGPWRCVVSFKFTFVFHVTLYGVTNLVTEVTNPVTA